MVILYRNYLVLQIPQKDYKWLLKLRARRKFTLSHKTHGHYPLTSPPSNAYSSSTKTPTTTLHCTPYTGSLVQSPRHIPAFRFFDLKFQTPASPWWSTPILKWPFYLLNCWRSCFVGSRFGVFLFAGKCRLGGRSSTGRGSPFCGCFGGGWRSRIGGRGGKICSANIHS